MSITPFIKTHEENGVLFRVLPPRGQAALRTLFLTAEAARGINDSNSPIRMLGSAAAVQQMLEKWVVGGRMAVRLSGKKAGATLARLDEPPPEIWDLRVTQPVCQVRIFCRFAAMDSLIVTHMSTRGLLGNAGSREWQKAMAKCLHDWEALFPQIPVFKGSSVNDYISANAEDITSKPRGR